MHLKSSEDCLPVAKYILQNAVHECYYLIFRSFPGRSSSILTAIEFGIKLPFLPDPKK